VVGFGGIGRRLAELLEPFHVPLRVFDPHVPDAVLRAHRAERTPLLTLLRRSEVVVLCAANTGETRRLLGPREIAALRKDAVLVNVGRAHLLDMDALLRRLRRGDLLACLDVFEQEPLPADSPLRRLPNVYLTPHRAGGVMESAIRLLTMLADDFEAHLDGRPRRWALTRDMLSSLP
jgi:phosphoglycerate dehydrogenase-like enzyme